MAAMVAGTGFRLGTDAHDSCVDSATGPLRMSVILCEMFEKLSQALHSQRSSKDIYCWSDDKRDPGDVKLF